tara:strand:- start:80 stop:319 length:240 start_codon:yes stop_codon:yes gene_type:complete
VVQIVHHPIIVLEVEEALHQQVLMVVIVDQDLLAMVVLVQVYQVLLVRVVKLILVYIISQVAEAVQVHHLLVRLLVQVV